MSYRKNIASLALSITLLLAGGGVFAAQNTEYERITQEMAELRDLELLEPLDIEMQTRAELREWLLESAEGAPVEEEEYAERVLTFLGFIEPDTDISELETAILGEQIAGYYDPETNEMVVVRSNEGDELSANDELTFAHEAVHALQDQHFDLMGVRGDVETISDDEYLATTALVEGDATVAQVLYLIENPSLLSALEDELGDFETPELDSAPLYYSETLLFPYDQGATFVMEIYEEGGWEAVDAMYDAPPTTTEQILHTHKYIDGEGAIDVSTPEPLPALDENWEVIEENSLGEFLVDVFLRNGGARDEDAQRASEGWGGDAMTIVGDADETAMIWNTAWDTDDDALEFFRILARTEAERLDGEIEIVSDDTQVRIVAEGFVGEVVLNGDTVTYTLAEDDATLNALTGEDGQATPQANGG